jgi:catechol 2,3-dioxygenase-like lactoylglutathione lyase family enzyme
MYDHIGFKVKDLEASLRFYSETLATLGYVVAARGDTWAGLGPEGAPALWLYCDDESPSRGVHIAFRAPNRAAVQAFYAAGIEAGGRDNGGPGPRTDYSPTYYAAFLLDPDGNNVEAVHGS